MHDLSWCDAASVRCRASPAVYISVIWVKVAKLVKCHLTGFVTCHLTSFVIVTIQVKCGDGGGRRREGRAGKRKRPNPGQILVKHRSNTD